MTWWAAVLATLGVVGFWLLLVVVGDPIDRWRQARMAAQLRLRGERDRTVGGE